MTCYIGTDHKHEVLCRNL